MGSDNDPKVSLWLSESLPGIRNLGDVTKVWWGDVPAVDIITAGYPCQPFSLAGLRKGVEDPRHIWPFIFEGICAIRPRFVVLENVPGHRRKGFGQVLGDLAKARYDCRWVSLSASAAGAPHKRERVFIVATQWTLPIPNSPGESGDGCWQAGESWRDEPSDCCHSPSWWWLSSEGKDYGPAVRRWERVTGRIAPPANEHSARAQTGRRLSVAFGEWMMGLPEGHITGRGLNRQAHLKLIGNGVVPQQAYEALKIMFGVN